MKLSSVWEWIDQSTFEFKKLGEITANTGRNPTFVRVRIDMETEDAGWINIDQTIGKRMTPAQRRKIEDEAEREFFANYDGDVEHEPKPEIIDAPGLISDWLFA